MRDCKPKLNGSGIKPEVKEEVVAVVVPEEDRKPSIKAVVTKRVLKKTRPKLLLSDSDSDDEDVATDGNNGCHKPSIYEQKRIDMKNRLEQRKWELKTNSNTTANANTTANDSMTATATTLTEDPLIDVDCLNGKSNGKPNGDLAEVLELLNMLGEKKAAEANSEASGGRSNDVSADEDHRKDVSLNDSIVEVIEHVVNGNTETRGRPNTRSSARLRSKSKTRKNKKSTAAKSKGPTPPKKTKRNSLDEEKRVWAVLDQLDAERAVDEMEVLGDSMTEHNNSFNASQELQQYVENRDIEWKVQFRTEIKKFKMKSNDKFSSIMPAIAATFGQQISTLVLRLKDRDEIIGADDTPHSLDMNVADIVECHKRVAVDSNAGTSNGVANNVAQKDPNVITIKLRDKNMKTPVELLVSKFATIAEVMAQFAARQAIAGRQFRFEFDSDRLDPNSTVNDCGIDNDDQIDVIYKV